MRSRRVAFVYVPVIFLLTMITDIRDIAPWTAAAVGLVYVVAGALRLRLSAIFDRTYDAAPSRWRKHFALVTIVPAACWGLLLPLVGLKLGVSWSFLVCLLATAGIAAGAISSLSPRMVILRWFVSVQLAPSAVALAISGHGREAGLAVLLLVFWAQMLILGRYFHAEMWSGMRKGAELEERAVELAAANQEALAANVAKSEFLTNMSHEIRTPLNGILGLTGVVLESDLTGDQRELLTDVHTSGEMLLRIVNEVLDFSKIEAGRLELESTTYSLAELVDSVVKPQQVDAARRGNTLTATVGADVPAWVRGDDHRLGQVLTNLVGNALKFTENGRVDVTIALEERRADVPTLSIRVSDTGIGIPREAQSTIFEAFRQADGSTTRKFGGTGLGLAITSRLVGLMGGRISLVSAPGQGSTFCVLLPLAEGTAPRAAASRTTAAPADGAELPAVRVLLAEDNPVNAKLATRLLAKLDVEVTWAGNGRLAVDAWQGGDFDIVLMDVQMPEMDGFEATAAIRAAEAADGRRRTPIIALTAHALDGYREKCLQGGMDDYLTKPLKAAELAAAVARWQPVAV